MGRWAVVIASDNLGNLRQCAKTVLDTHKHQTAADIIVVSREIKQGQLPAELRGLTVVEDSSKFNFSRRINMGCRKASRDVVILGDDVEVLTPGAFDQLASESPLRLIAPSVKGRIGPWWQRESQDHADVPFVSFTCVYLPRDVYDIVGPLEEGFPGYGYEDTDYCIRVRKAGLSCGVKGSVVVGHNLGIKSDFVARHGQDLAKMQEEAHRAFVRKHRK